VTFSVNAAMPGSYDHLQVALSVVIAIAASYAALDLAGRVTAASGWARSVWLTGGAVAMGIGIWSMHFTAMLAFHLPVPVGYHWPTVMLSLLVGILSSAFALHVASRQKMGRVQAVISSVAMGVGIAAVHYIGMAAMRLSAVMQFNFLIVVFSVVLAMAFSLAALVTATVASEFIRGGRVISRHTGQNLLASMVTLTRRNTRRYGGYIVHFGVVVIVVGLAGAAFNQQTEQEMVARVPPGRQADIEPRRRQVTQPDHLSPRPRP